MMVRDDEVHNVRSAHAIDRAWIRTSLTANLVHQGTISDDELERLLTSCEMHPPTCYVLETSSRLVGWSLARRGRLESTPPLHPWECWTTRGQPLSDPTAETWWIRTMAWTAGPLSAARREWLVREVGQRLGLQVGAERVRHWTRPLPTAEQRTSMAPKAYLQQVHYGAIDDERLTPLMSMGFRLDGYRDSSTDESSIEVLMTWEA